MNFSSYNVGDGLVQSNVKSICEDRYGNLWLATSGGLSRFDGIKFTNYKKNNGLIDNRTLSVIEDQSGNIWIGTYNGLSKFNGKKFSSYLIDTSEAAKNMITTILEDSKGDIWVSSSTGGISKISGDKLVQYNTVEELSDVIVSSIVEDKEGNIWISTYNDGLFIYKNGGFSKIAIPASLDQAEISTLFVDSKNRKWIGTSKGLYKIENGKYESINSRFPVLNNYGITTMEEDKEGNLWMATFTGVLKYSLSDKGNIFAFDTTQGLTNNIVYDIHMDREGILWFGTFGKGFFKSMGDTFYRLGISQELKESHSTTIEKVNGTYWLGTYGEGIFKYVPGNATNGQPEIVNYAKGKGSAEDYIFCSVVDNSGNLWFGSVHGLKKYDGNRFRTYTTHDGLTSNWISSACKDQDGNLWFGTTNGLIKYDGNSFKNFSIGQQEKDNWVRSMYVLSDGKLLLGTFGGVYTFDGKCFTKFFADKRYQNKNIFAFSEDSINDRLWLGTIDEGIIRYDLESRTAVSFTEADGLTSDIIYSLIVGDDGSLFLGTQNGIDKITVDESGNIVRIANYNSSEGFTGIETNINAVYKEEDGSIWFGSINGFFKYNAGRDEKNTLEPITHLTGLKLFYEDVSWEHYADSISSWYNIPYNLKLPYNQNHLSFEYMGHSLKNPRKVRYKYKLENFDKEWSPVTSSTKAVYANLPPDSYTFKVMAENSDGVWNKSPVAYSFTIATPFWLTWWFFALLICLALVVVKLYYDYRVRKKLHRLMALEKIKIEASEKVRKKVAMDFHDEMGNHLVSISVLVQLVNAKLGSSGNEMGELLSRLDQSSKSLFNGAKDFIWAIDPKNDGLYATVIYIKDFGEDLFDRANVEFHVQTNDIYKSTAKLPPGWSRQIVLIFKEALTNCLKHANCKNVYMTFELDDRVFKVWLKDDGIGFEKNNVKKGVGMVSMQTRAKQIAGNFSIDTIQENGTEIVFSLKIPKIGG